MGETGCLHDVPERIGGYLRIAQFNRDLRSNDRTHRPANRCNLDTMGQPRTNVIVVGIESVPVSCEQAV